jgi:alkylhydroperoxidase family enzyme
MADNHVPAAAYEEVAQQFSPGEVAALLSLIVAINAWNAVGVAARPWVPGTYQP